MYANNFYALDDKLFLREQAIFVPETSSVFSAAWTALFNSSCTSLSTQFQIDKTLQAWNAKAINQSPLPYAFVGYHHVYNVQMYISFTDYCPVSHYAFLYILPLFADVKHRPLGAAFDPATSTSDVTLQAIDKVNYYFPNAINADRHYATNLQPYEQTFDNTEFAVFIKQNYGTGFNIRQAHAANSPYTACAVLLSSEHHVICTGSTKTKIIYASSVPTTIRQRVLTMAHIKIHNTAYVLWTQGHAHPFSAVLKMRGINEETTHTFHLTECSTWISLSVYHLAHQLADDNNQFTAVALEYHVARLQVSIYKLQISLQEDLSIVLIRQQSIHVNLPNYQIIAGNITTGQAHTEEDWLRYCRVVHGNDAHHALVACVHKIPSSTETGKSKAMMIVPHSKILVKNHARNNTRCVTTARFRRHAEEPRTEQHTVCYYSPFPHRNGVGWVIDTWRQKDKPLFPRLSESILGWTSIFALF